MGDYLACEVLSALAAPSFTNADRASPAWWLAREFSLHDGGFHGVIVLIQRFAASAVGTDGASILSFCHHLPTQLSFLTHKSQSSQCASTDSQQPSSLVYAKRSRARTTKILLIQSKQLRPTDEIQSNKHNPRTIHLRRTLLTAWKNFISASPFSSHS